MKHLKSTPGPWTANFDDNQPTVVNSEGVLIADVNVFDGTEEDANAYLIAAAPELLEACRWAITELTATEEQRTADTLADTLERLREAIKKASY